MEKKTTKTTPTVKTTAPKAVAKATPAKVAAKAPAVKTVAKPAVKVAPAKVATPVKAEVKPAPAKAAPKASKPAVKKVVKQINKQGDRPLRKTRIGKVISNKMSKTIVVAVETKIPHSQYKKIVANTKKFKAHDENNECSIGDTVEIVETRKISKDKYFRLLRVIEKVK